MSRRASSYRRRRRFTIAWFDLEAGTELHALDERLRAEGYERSGRIKTYLCRDNSLTIRFVWRRRTPKGCDTHTLVYSGVSHPQLQRAA